MEDGALADRLVNYADGLVAASFVVMGGIGAALGDPEIRCELADAAPKLIVVILLAGGCVLFALRWLRLRAARLRVSAPVSEDAETILARLDVVRVFFAVAFILGACVFVSIAVGDETCQTMLQGRN